MSVVREQRRVLPYSVTACRRYGAVAVVGVAIQLLAEAVSRSGSTACNLQRIVASDGRRSGAMPTASAGGGRDVREPLGDRGVRAIASRHGAYGGNEDDRQSVQHPETAKGIRQI